MTMHARPANEYHEDMGAVLWWKFPINEPPYVGTPGDAGYEVVIETQSSVATYLGEAAPPVEEVRRIHVGGWPGYHTHWTPIENPIPASPLSSGELGK